MKAGEHNAPTASKGAPPAGRRRRGQEMRGPSAGALARRCRGRSVGTAAVYGRKGAVRHFLKEDPTCVKATDGSGGEAWFLSEVPQALGMPWS